MKKILCLLLAVLTLASFAACGSNNDPETTTAATTTAETTAATTTEAATTEATTTATTTEATTTVDTTVTVENPAIYFSMTIGDSDTGSYVSLTAMEMDPGSIRIEYVGDVKKVGDFDPSVMHAITAALNETALWDLNNRSEYEEGSGFASMFIQFADDSMLMADFTGAVPAEFFDGYEAMDIVFAALTAELDVYVPQPMVMGEVNETGLTEMLAILNGTGIDALDTLTIADIPLDETFAYTAGLSGTEGILHGTTCAPMMLATAYSLVIVEAESADAIDAIRADFAANLDWAKWICVSATDAVIAQKGNLVVCLMSTDDWFTRTANGIENAGWEAIETIHNPNF